MPSVLSFGENRGYDALRPQYKLALQFLKKIKCLEDKTILDVGCGMGEFIDILRKKGVKNVVGVEGSQKSCLNVRRNGSICYNINLEDGLLPFKDEEFDIIVSLEVIEHLWNTEKYLSEICRVLKKGGYVLFTTPNYNHYTYRMHHLFGRFEYFTYKSRHKKFYTVQSFKRELAGYLKVISAKGSCTFPILRRKFFGKKFLNLFAIHIGIMCRKQ